MAIHKVTYFLERIPCHIVPSLYLGSPMLLAMPLRMGFVVTFHTPDCQSRMGCAWISYVSSQSCGHHDDDPVELGALFPTCVGNAKSLFPDVCERGMHSTTEM